MNSRIKIIFISCIFLFSLSAFSSNHQYAVLIDAGSTGSRAHVFEYEKSYVPIIHDIYNKSTSPGLSSYANTPAAAGASLQPILDEAALYLQNKGVPLSKVSVSVLATAGMRLLTLDEQQAIYTSVRNYIRNNYAFSLKDQDVRTITGQLEGVFGWLDINYLSNNFTDSSTTVGSIDMGGASTQIAFATTDTSQPENEVTLKINNKNYRIFSQSFLGLGQNQALSAMMANKESPSCYPENYSYNTQTGNFNFSTCSKIYTEIIENYNPAESVHPDAGQPFIAYSGIFYAYDFFNLLKSPTQNELQSQIDANCYLSWDTLQSKYPAMPTKSLANYCAHGVYFDALIYNAYQLQSTQLTVTDNINDTNIDWTLGALLYSLVQKEE